MWAKKELLSYYCVVLLAVTIATATFSKDATVPKRNHQVERLGLPSLERRQRPVGNHTRSIDLTVSTSKDAQLSSVFEFPETSQTPTRIATPTPMSPSESSSPASSSPARTEPGPDFTFVTLSSSHVDISTTSLHITESTVPTSLGPEQRSSQSSLDLSQFPTSEPAIPSTVFEPTPFMSSSTEEAMSSSSMDFASSRKLEPTPTAITVSDHNPSSEANLSPSAFSVSSPVSGISQAQSGTYRTMISDGVITVTSIVSRTSIVQVPTSFTFVPDTSHEVVSITKLTSQPSIAATTPVEQQQDSIIVSSSDAPSTTASSPAVTAAHSDAQAPILSSIAAFPNSMSDTTETSTSAVPESTTVFVPSGLELSANSKTLVSSETTSSILLSLISGPGSISVPPTAVSAIEGTTPTPSISSLSFSATHISSTVQHSSTNLAVSLITTNSIPGATMGWPSGVTTSTTTTILASSTQVEQELTVSGTSNLPSSVASSQILPTVHEVSTSAQSSLLSVSPSLGTLVTTETSQYASTSEMVLSTLAEVTSAVSGSLNPSSPASLLAPSPTFVVSSASKSSPFRTTSSSFGRSTELTSVSLGSSFLSSITASSETTSSFLFSETLVASATSLGVSPSEASTAISQTSDLGATLSATRHSSTGLPSTTTTRSRSKASLITASPSQTTENQISSVSSSDSGSSSFSSAFGSSSVSLSSLLGVSTSGASPVPEPTGLDSTTTTWSSAQSSSPTAGLSDVSSVSSSEAMLGMSTTGTPLPSSIRANDTQVTLSPPTASGTITATISTVYVFKTRSSVLDLSTVAFSLFSSATEAAVNLTEPRTSSTGSVTIASEGIETRIPASETLRSSNTAISGANSSWKSPMQQPSQTATVGSLNSVNITRTSVLGVTFSRSVLPTGAALGTGSVLNNTQAESLQTSSVPVAANSTTVGLFLLASTISHSASQALSGADSKKSAFSSERTSTDGSDYVDKMTSISPYSPTSSADQTAGAPSPPPLTTSQTAGVAVGATTGLLIAVVAVIFIVRRYHAANHGKRMSNGSIYPKIAYLYDPKTGGDGGDAEALMPGPAGSPSGPVSGVARGTSVDMQRHSTGKMPFTRFTNPGNPFTETIRGSATHRYSEYARVDTTRALSAAVAGYGGAPSHSHSYTKYPSDVTNTFNDHVIPSPTFAPFSPDDIGRPGLRTPHDTDGGRGQYSRMVVDSHAYLNTPASMYPPISPYGRPSTQEPSSTNNTRRQTIDSDPFADPFEHDLLLHVDEQNRTSDSVTIFAPSPNLLTPRTPRTPVGPNLPVRQPNGMTSARSLLSPMAAKYLLEAQEVKIPQKSVASPVLVQVGRSPIIKPFSPPPAAPEPLGWDNIKRNSEKYVLDERNLPAPLKFASPVVKKKPVPGSHTRTKPSLTGAGQALMAGNGLPLTVKIPHRYIKSVGLDVPRVGARSGSAHEELSNDPMVREKRSGELRFADPALVGKKF